MYKKSVLSNGLKIVTFDMPHMQSVALGIWINTGSRFENKHNNGVAHFLEHLLFKGSFRFSCRKIKESLEGRGGSLNGFTSEELCCYLVKLPFKYLNLALDILSDMVLNPLLNQEDIEKEKNVIIEEIKMHRDLPQSYVHELLDGLLWPGETLGKSILGTSDSITAMSRKDLLEFKQKNYTPANIVIAACGNLKHQVLLEQAKDIFKSSKQNTRSRFKKIKPYRKTPRIKLLVKETEQTHFSLGFHGLRRSDDNRFALALLNVILGANMSSRLFNEVREKKGLAYQINSQVKYLFDTGSLVINAGVDNDNAIEALQVILKELDKIKQDLVSESEFKRAKEFYLGQLAISLEDTLEHMLWIGESVATLDRIFELNEVIEDIKQIEPKDLRDLAKEVFKVNDRNLAIIGPLKEKKESLYECLRD